mmetsp:Transcript_30745/g.60549  ORF Transcript_30745/g.60549 Transcript_30745/m.60549 type:complete len:240 (+) Transcript_30745:1179-1898(+)
MEEPCTQEEGRKGQTKERKKNESPHLHACLSRSKRTLDSFPFLILPFFVPYFSLSPPIPSAPLPPCLPVSSIQHPSFQTSTHPCIHKSVRRHRETRQRKRALVSLSLFLSLSVCPSLCPCVRVYMGFFIGIIGAIVGAEPLDLGALFMRDLWMWGMTPPPAMVALMSPSSSSSPLMASCRCLGVILFTLRSLEAFPANSRTSAVRYSRMAAAYTAAVAPTLLLAATLPFNRRWIRPTGN